jgi:ribosomal 30S subunit maturation factor RimM
MRGELHVQLFRPRRDKADARENRSIYLDEKEHALKSVRWISPVAVVLRVDGLDDRTQAEALEGMIVSVDPRALPAAITDDADLYVGARAVDAQSSRDLGVVEAIVDNGAQPMLQLERDGREYLVPCVPVFIAGFDSGVVKIHVMPGLFDDVEA